MPLKDLLDAQNDEAKSSLQVKLARARLLVLGLPPEELDKIAEEEGTQKARMTLRSPVDGIVIKRSVVVGNYYEPKDELMQISPLDPMNVTAAVSENLLDRIHPGLDILVSFPFDDHQLKATVQSVDPMVNPETGTFLIRTAVPNADHRLKAGMFVQVLLPPASGPKPEPTPRPTGEHSSDAVLNERLDIIERKLDRILGGKPRKPRTTRSWNG